MRRTTLSLQAGPKARANAQNTRTNTKNPLRRPQPPRRALLCKSQSASDFKGLDTATLSSYTSVLPLLLQTLGKAYAPLFAATSRACQMQQCSHEYQEYTLS